MQFRFPHAFVRPAALLAAMASVVACSDGTGPRGAPIESLTISGVRIDTESFRTHGEFALGLLARDADGSSILDSRASASATVVSVTPGDASAYSVSAIQTRAEEPGNQPTYAAILLDDSGSMRSNDPLILRADAARVFWEAVLPARPGNHVSLLDFGAGSTPGFAVTRLLQSWTRSTDDLEDQLARIGAFGSTPMYRSIEETAEWMVQSVPSTAHRVILLLGDGAPTDGSRRTLAIEAVKDARITVHTVGLGPASEAAGATRANAVAAIREIAEQTAGVYSSATDASALAPIFDTLAQVTSKGQLIGSFRVSPVPPAGTRVEGTVTVTSGGSSRVATWSFLAP